ncbi:DEAD/DEAH box helicase [Cohnella nanjingensis]|uniref:DEAD/DEAH box helicase n=1 Tax=Cohnella nanjingensis TaxID=1387779 RepID=A0A7X0RR30_9BACL|nr:DEAD/DEAH box helicase [Cohnella nanjingensis]MBB6672108.1 DEAD/DEAH box helicase [Cohnella nanjingensis]
MSTHLNTIQIRLSMSGHGDAVIWGTLEGYSYVPGTYVKQRLFAWHAPSFYGTELEVKNVQDGIDVVILPAEQVIPFFAELHLLRHIDWVWADGASRALIKLAPMLAESLEARKFAPSLSAFRQHKLQWTWDAPAVDEALAAIDRAEAREPDDESSEEERLAFLNGLQAAFSASVSERHFGTEAEAADLRREYPLLFARDPAAFTGMDAESWLVAVGWKADAAPFRPVLQLLEPDEDVPEWRLRLMLQDKRDPTALAPASLSAGGEATGSWPGAWTAHVRQRAESWLDRLRASLPEGRLGNGADVLARPLDDQAAWQFLTVDSRRLLEGGWQVLLPAWWEAASRKKPRLRAKIREGEGDPAAKKGGGGSLFGLDSIIDFDWRIAIGDTEMTEAEFAELIARGERLVKFRGQWVPLDPALLAQIRRAMDGMDKSQGLSFQDVLQLHLLANRSAWAASNGETAEPEPDPEAGGHAARVELEVELNAHLARIIDQLVQQAEWPKLPAPAGLRAELRAYQRDGYSWLAFLRTFGLGACLADDMGLGKTVQLISYLLHIRESGADTAGIPSLVICPTSVLGNWQKELSRFAPSLRVMLHYGARRAGGEAFADAIREADVVLTSFATAALDQETLQAYTWATLCLDEAQNIKNAQTKQSAAVRSIPARHRVALTGTPIENRLAELWSIYDFMNPGYLGSARAFQERFAAAVERERDERRTADLQQLVKPFMLRRKKKDPAIQLDLPEKNEMKTYIHLTAEQASLYDQTVGELLERVRKLEGIERKGAILAALTHLKQLCDHPMLTTKEPLPASDDGEGLDTDMLIGRSAKLERLMAMVRELRDEGERCLIFTQYIGMGEMLRAVLQQELGEPVLYLNGSTSKTARDRMIERFQSQTLPPEEQPNVFILSLKAGGVGLNLTAANHVFHFDRWWNPAVENQATDRAFRMGQTRDVQVHKFISLGTLEEKIDEMLENKQALSDNVISASEGWITELSTDALRDLFVLRRDW